MLTAWADPGVLAFWAFRSFDMVWQKACNSSKECNTCNGILENSSQLALWRLTIACRSCLVVWNLDRRLRHLSSSHPRARILGSLMLSGTSTMMTCHPIRLEARSSEYQSGWCWLHMPQNRPRVTVVSNIDERMLIGGRWAVVRPRSLAVISKRCKTSSASTKLPSLVQNVLLPLQLPATISIGLLGCRPIVSR